MAQHVPRAPGFASMMKEGAQHYSGLDEAVYKNIEACRQLAASTRTTYGPNGMSKMLINHIDKMFVTSDAATILKELEVHHPAAKLLVLASQQQDQEAGDGTNLTLIFAGALLEQAEELLKMGLSPTEIIEGYELAVKKALEILPDLVCHTVTDLRNKEEVVKAITPAIATKQLGTEGFLAGLIADACIGTLKDGDAKRFNVDNIRVCKILGCGVLATQQLNGMVFKRKVDTDITKASGDRVTVAIYSCPFDALQTETKGTVLIKSADELKAYSKGEEELLEGAVAEIRKAGVDVVVTGGKVGDHALHFANKYGLMVVRLVSKWDLRRLCRATGARALPRLGAPTPEETGRCLTARIDEVGDTPVVVFETESAVSTLVIRGSTDNVMDDVERAVDDGVNNYKALTRDPRLVPGAGACEVELATRLATYADSLPGLHQYSVQKFSEALEVVPRALAENSGVKATVVVSALYAAHQRGETAVGFDATTGEASVTDVVSKGILDAYLTKHWALKFASVAACTVLKVDQIIMAKQAGGPKPPAGGGGDMDED